MTMTTTKLTMSAAAAADDEEATTSLTPPHAAALLSSFSAFLTMAVHSLLYHRRLYPASSFLVARAYNLPVHQSRHPGVCAWVRDAVSAVSLQVRAGAVRRVLVALHAPGDAAVVERWVFDLAAFPAVHHHHPASRGRKRAPELEPPVAAQGQEPAVNWTDVHEALRGALRRVAYAAETLPPPPDDCTFSLAVELRDDAPAPIEHPQLWIPSEPHLQPPTPSNPNTGSALGGASTTPIRAVQAGPLFFECWVEQGTRKHQDHTAGTQDAGDDGGDNSQSSS